MNQESSPQESSPQDSTREASPRVKSIVSLVLFVHLFLVFTALSSNLRPWNSPVQSKVLDTFAPYLATLAWDPEFRAFHLTHAMPLEDDHVIEIDLKATATATVDRTITLPGESSRFSPDRRRYLSLAHELGLMADGDQDARSGELAKSIGRHFLSRTGARHAVVRCYRHEAQPLYLDQLNEGYPADATDVIYRQMAYAADVFVADDGRVFVGKISSSRESASAVPKSGKGSK